VPIARARVARFTRAIPRSVFQHPTLYTRKTHGKTADQNVMVGQSYGPRSIFFAARTTFDFSHNMAISSAIPYVAARGADLAGEPMGAHA
jgi:hypothetical protein